MPSETIVAVYDTAGAAEAAVASLVESGVPESAIQHYGQEARGATTALGTTEPAGTVESTGTGSGGGFWGWLTGEKTDDTRRLHEARHYDEYDRSISGGRNVVTVIADETEASNVIAILERHSPVDLEEHDAGASRYGGTSTTGTVGSGIPTGTAAPIGTTATDTTPGATLGTTTGTTTTGASPAIPATGVYATAAGRTGDVPSASADSVSGASARTPLTGEAGREQVLALSEEELEVGKRAIDRGITRIRRYVVERPVEEQIRLRDETVSVFRRPVAQRGELGADAFTDKVIEMTETDEEAVVAKTAHVTEEVVLRKDVSERDETVRDTVRKEEVEITGPGGGATGTTTGPKPGTP